MPFIRNLYYLLVFFPLTLLQVLVLLISGARKKKMTQSNPHSSTMAFGLDNKRANPINLDHHYDLRIGEPKLSPFPTDVLDDLYDQKNIHCYYPSHGDPKLREMLLNKYYPLQTIDNIAITHGTMGALDFILRASFAQDQDSEILIPDPGFPPYNKLAQFSNARILRYRLNLEANPNSVESCESCINWEHVESLITEKTKLILINSPHNPTGKTLSEVDYLCFVRLLEDHPNLSFLMDEVYRELIYDHKIHYDFSSFINRGYVVGSFSKMYPLQGARIGWLLTSNEKMKELTPYFNNATGAISSFGQELAKGVLERDLSFKEQYQEAATDVQNILDAFDVDYIRPEGAFFVFIKYSMSGVVMADELADLGVDVVPGVLFGPSGENYIRASFAQAPDVLQKAFLIIASHWSKLHPRVDQ